MKKRKIAVLGSSNTDMVVRSAHLPKPGETVIGGQFLMNPGGKGANQAVAAARLGGDVVFIAKVGNDIFGKQAIEGFKGHGIDTRYIYTDAETPSGVALIMVDGHGENSISVALGANATITKNDVDEARTAISESSYMLMQLETPLEVIAHAIEVARNAKVPVVLNPAPAQALTDELLSKLNVITPNQSESELLTGVAVHDVSSAHDAALKFIEKGVENVVITMGSAGAYVLTKDVAELVPSEKVKAVDSTAAGDTFNGALVVGLNEGMDMLEAVRFANKAAAFSVTRMGAQSSTPMRSDL